MILLIPGIISTINKKPPVMPTAIFKPFRISFFETVPLNISLKCQNSKKRDTELSNNKSHCDCPELIVTREIFNKQIC